VKEQRALLGCGPDVIHVGKHLPKATSNLGEPLIRIFRRSKAHSKRRAVAKYFHDGESASVMLPTYRQLPTDRRGGESRP